MNIQHGYFGQVTDQTGAAPGPRMRVDQLPSSASVNAVLQGEQGGWGKVAASTGLRAILIAPGMALAGATGRNLVWGSLLSSATITAFLFIFYGAKRDGAA